MEDFKPVRSKSRKNKPRQEVYNEKDAEVLSEGDITLVPLDLERQLECLTLEENATKTTVKSTFKALSAADQEGKSAPGKKFIPIRRILVPANRYAPLKKDWDSLIEPLVNNMDLQVRMNTRTRAVEIRPSPRNRDASTLQKGADYVKAFLVGFSIADAVALLRIEDMFIQSFQVHDVKNLQGDHLSRCIGRIAGKDGKTKHAIENSTRSRLVVAGEHIHILGSHQSIKLCRDAVCSLILGSPPGKVYNHLRIVSRRMKERA